MNRLRKIQVLFLGETFLLFLAIGFAAIEAVNGHEFSEEEKAWWAVQPVKGVTPSGEGHPVDGFVVRKLEGEGLKMAAVASPEEFVRRAYFDLHGLPPKAEEVDVFVEEWKRDQDQAVEELIDELLKSPRYGERWGQHWLDVVRYADSDGYRADDFRPAAYRYRDYVIRAFNEDKPYDEFVREQLAADELAPNDPERVAATGFLRNGVYEWNQRDAEMQRELMINEITNVTGEVFLGMGIGCAQCHDHKFDPILQRDYFSMQAFLSSVYWPDDRYYATTEEIAEYERKLAVWEEKTADIRSEMEALVQKGQKGKYDFRVKTFPPEVQEMFAVPWEKKSSYERQISFLVERQAAREVKTVGAPEKILKKDTPERLRYAEFEKELAEFDGMKPAPLPKAFVSTDTGKEAATVTLKSEEIAPRFLTLLGGEVPKIQKRKETTGRRTALADWIVRKDNPLTARVMVNRIWQHHFGRGIAASPNDFGMLGAKPSHPELLDWLAVEFVTGDWKIKRMHRLIMTSKAYRQTARFEPSNAHDLADPENRLLWRYPPKRLSAEQIRDAMLALSGELKHREGGAAQGSDVPVRSIYVKKMRNSPDQILQCFDSPAGFASEPDRVTTTTPTQSLMVSNSEWPLARGRALAGRILGGKKSADEADVVRAYRDVWGRKASEDEVTAALVFLKKQEGLIDSERTGNPEKQKSGLVGLGEFQGARSFLSEEAKGAIQLKSGSGKEKLELPGVDLKDDHFTIAGVVRLEGIHSDARVNTLAAQWNGNQQQAGWTIGVTSAKSRYEPRNFIMQLTGRNPGGDLEYEVVASGLRVPLKVPVFMAAVVDPQPNGAGKVTFYLKDLSKKDSKMQRAEIAHNIISGIRKKGEKVLVGDRSGGAHFWNGQVARLAMFSELLTEEQLLNFGNPLIDLRVTEPNTLPSEARWLGGKAEVDQRSPGREAFADFCHALLSSNEFLYLH